MPRLIHIVCLDAPSPPDYGGAIDMFYKIKALASVGTKIILHYFGYNPLRNTAGLETYCEAIYKYERRNFFLCLPFKKPYIVQSRINKKLIDRLNSDDHPILIEGLHGTGVVPYIKNKARIVVRMHNDEATYYQHLAQNEKSFLKKKYFQLERWLLANYQQKLNKNLMLACLSKTDEAIFREQYRFLQTTFLPCFLPWQTISINPGLGDYCLYHGNMLVSENEEAVLWLLKNVFHQLKVPFAIAGKGISERVKKEAQLLHHVRLYNNPTPNQLDELVQNAQINVLPSVNATGVKLKLLNALFNGRHCITNPKGIMGSEITSGVIIAQQAEDWKLSIEKLMKTMLTEKDKQDRISILHLYNNNKNAEKLNALWKHYQ